MNLLHLIFTLLGGELFFTPTGNNANEIIEELLYIIMILHAINIVPKIYRHIKNKIYNLKGGD